MNTLYFTLLFLILLQPLLSAKPPWFGVNEARIDRLIHVFGKASPRYDPQKKPLAVFDWDNTVIKNDIGDATFFWFVSHNLIHWPKDWRKTSRHLTGAAVRELSKKCPGHPECADIILSIYDKGGLPDGKSAAWKKDYDPDLLEPAYAWVAQLMAGYTPDEMRKIVEQVIRFNLKNKIGKTQKVGSHKVPSFIRVYEPMKELISRLKKNGFDAWVVSASSQYIVEPFAKRVGIDPDHVIGIRPVLSADGKITADFQGCGTVPNGQSIITYRQGKRCWINKVIFGVENPLDQLEKSSPIVFAAGDSDTDLFFLRDATALRLVINRNKRELMCHAYANTDGKWIVNPMFILPKPKLKAGYSCEKLGLTDQEDLVY